MSQKLNLIEEYLTFSAFDIKRVLVQSLKHLSQQLTVFLLSFHVDKYIIKIHLYPFI